MVSSKKTRFYNLICVFLVCFVFGIRAVDYSYAVLYSTQAVIYLIYTSAIFIWMTQVKRRIINKEERKYLIMVGFLSILLILLRTVKYMFIPLEHITHRYTWYFYYFPQIFSVLFMFFAVLHIGKPYHYSINKKWKLLYLPAWLLFLCILTNDIHEKAFSFEGASYKERARDYSHEFFYYLVAVWLIVWLSTIVFIVFSRCAVSKSKQRIWRPLVILFFALLYFILFVLDRQNILFLYVKVAEMIVFVFIAFMESLILSRLIPSNDNYDVLWEASHLYGGIMSEDGKICFRSKDFIKPEIDDVKKAEYQAIPIEGTSILLRSLKIKGGYGFWTKNISEIQKINQKLADLGDVLTEENTMLEGENLLAEKKFKIEQQNLIYDNISRDVAPQLIKIERNLSEIREKKEKEFEKRLKFISVLLTYIKRRSNLLLISNQRETIPIEELRLSIGESLEHAGLLGIKSFLEVRESEPVDAETVLFLYEFFQSVLEQSVYKLNSIMIDIYCVKGLSMMRAEMSPPIRLEFKEHINFMLEKLQGDISYSFEEDAQSVTLTLGGKEVVGNGTL